VPGRIEHLELRQEDMVITLDAFMKISLSEMPRGFLLVPRDCCFIEPFPVRMLSLRVKAVDAVTWPCRI
jgi:hypothetical protein